MKIEYNKCSPKERNVVEGTSTSGHIKGQSKVEKTSKADTEALGEITPSSTENLAGKDEEKLDEAIKLDIETSGNNLSDLKVDDSSPKEDSGIQDNSIALQEDIKSSSEDMHSIAKDKEKSTKISKSKVSKSVSSGKTKGKSSSKTDFSTGLPDWVVADIVRIDAKNGTLKIEYVSNDAVMLEVVNMDRLL